MHRARRSIPPLLALMACDVVVAARFPNAVERSFELHGEAARTAAGWFGFEAEREGSLSLRLGRGEAWAVYLLKQDTPEPLSNDNEGSPPRFATIVYRPTPTLSLGPYWLDLGTRGPQPLPGTYSFSSGYLSSLEGEDPWHVLGRRLRADPAWQAKANPHWHRCVADEHLQLCLSAAPAHDYEHDVDGHVIGVTVEMQHSNH